MESIGTDSLEKSCNLSDDTDIKIRVHDTHVNCRRSELALLCLHFGTLNLQDIVIKSPDVTANGFQIWLQETRHPMSVTIGKDNVLELMSVANFTQSQRIIERCTSYCEAACRQTSLDIDHCGEIYSLALRLNMTNIVDEIERKVCRDFVNVLSCQQFKAAIGAEKLIQLLGTEGIELPSDVELLQTLLDWIRYDITSRGCVADDVLTHVKLHEIGAEDLKRTMYKTDLMAVPNLREAYMKEMHRYAIPSLMTEIPQRRMVLVTFKCKKPMYYNNQKHEWLLLPGLDLPGKITKCTVARDSIYAIVRRSQLWKYSSARNKWKEIETPIEETTKKSYDDLVFLNGKLYLMSDDRMWSKSISPPGNWNKCCTCPYRCLQTSSVAMGRYIMRFGKSRNKSNSNTWCNCYDTFADEYVLRRLLLWQPLMLMNRHGFSVLANYGTAIYDWYKWTQDCIKRGEAMEYWPDWDPGKRNFDKKFEISQDLVADEHRRNIIIIKGHVYHVVGHMLYSGMKEDTAAGAKNYDIATISDAVTISPGEKTTCILNLKAECFR